MEKNISDSLLSIMRKRKDEVADNESIIEMLSKKYEEASLENVKKEQKFYDIQNKLRNLDGVVRKLKEDRNRAFDTLLRISKMPEFDIESKNIIFPIQKSGNEIKSDSQAPETLGENYNYNFNVNFNDFIIAVRSSFKSLKSEIDKLKIENISLKGKLTNVSGELEAAKLTSLNYEKQFAQQTSIDAEIVKLKAEKDKIIKRYEERISKLEHEKEEKQLRINDFIEELAELKNKHQVYINELIERQKIHTQELIKQYDTENDDKKCKIDGVVRRVEKDNENLKKELDHTRNELREAAVDKNSKTRKIQQLENSLLEKEKQIKILQNDLEEQRTLHYEDKLKILELEAENEQMNSEADEVKELKKEMEHKNYVLSEDISIFKKQMVDMQEKISDMNELNEKLRNSTAEYQEVIDQLSKELSEVNEQVVTLKTENASMSSNLEIFERKEKVWDNERKSLKEEIDHNLKIIGNLNNEKGELLKELEQLHATFQECEDKMVEDNKLIEELTSKLEKEEVMQQNTFQKNNENSVVISELKEKIILLENNVYNKQKEIDELSKCYNEHQKNFEYKYGEVEAKYEDDLKKIKKESENTINDLKREISHNHQQLMEAEECINEQNLKIQKLEHEIIVVKEMYDKEVYDHEIKMKAKVNEIEDFIDKRDIEMLKIEKENSEFKKNIALEISKLSDELKVAEDKLRKEIDMYEELKLYYEKEKKVGIENRNLIDDLSFKLNEAMEKLEMYDNTLVQKNNLDKTIESLKKEHQSLVEEVLHEKDNNYQLSSSLAVAEKKLHKNNSLLRELEDKLEETKKALYDKVHEEDKLRLTIDDLQRQLIEESKKNTDLKDERENLVFERENLKKHLRQMENEVTILNTKLSERKIRYDCKKEELLIVNKKLKNIEEELNKSINQIDYWKETNQNQEREYEKRIVQLSEDKEKLLYLEDSCEELEKSNSNLLKEIATFKHTLEEEKKAKNKIVDELTIRITELERERYEMIRHSDEKVVDVELLKNKISVLSEKVTTNDKINKQLESECLNYLERLRNYELAIEDASIFILESEKFNDDMVFKECPAGKTNCRLPRLPIKTKLTETKKIRFSSAEGLIEKKSNLNTLTGSMYDINQTDFITQVFERYKKRIYDLEQERTNYRLQIQNLHTELNIVMNNSKDAEDKLEENQKDLNKLKKEKLDLENNLKNTRQLYLAQEENTRARELEKKNLKAKILSVDLHSRDKEARLQLLNNTIIQLQDENDGLKREIEKILDRERDLILEKDSLENKLCNIKTEMEITRHELNTVDREKHTIMTTFHNVYKKTSKTVESPDNSGKLILHLKELEKLIHNKKELLQKLENEEIKRMNRNDFKNGHFEILQLEGRLDTFKIEFSALVDKYKNCESEKDLLRKELLECKHQLSTAKIKINDLQITINNLATQKKKTEEMLSYVEKNEKNILQLKSELHNDVSHMKNDRLKLISEIEDLKRRLLRCEVEKRELEAHKGRLEREKSSLIRTVETLESEKNKLDGLLKKTLSEKATLDKSLSTIEKENSELYKNLSILKSQMGQMEKERLNKQAENVQKRKTQAEMEISRLNEEKRQLEKVYNQRDHNYNKKIAALEQEINTLKITLEIERKRRLEQLKNVNTGKGVSALTNKFENISYKK
uniref:GRIP domain-containing protein n=1 Tax=Strongyloides papillosus TaxID=174720 RepID=A0A0N5BHN4_STREA